MDKKSYHQKNYHEKKNAAIDDPACKNCNQRPHVVATYIVLKNKNL